MFAGEPEEIADVIIQRRMIEPFRTTAELEKVLAENVTRITKVPDRVKQAKPYITTQSSFFQIHVTSRCQNASCSAIATVFKDQKKVETLAVLYGR